MPIVNFVDEFRQIMRYSKDNRLFIRERALWIALFYAANDRAAYNAQTRSYNWPDGFIPVSNAELTLYSTLDKRGIDETRNALKQRGIIDFVKGNRNKSNPEYKLNYLSIDVGYKIVPNDVPNDVPSNVPNDVPSNVPNDVPNDVPSGTPFIIDYDNKGIKGNDEFTEEEEEQQPIWWPPEAIVRNLPGRADEIWRRHFGTQPTPAIIRSMVDFLLAYKYDWVDDITANAAVANLTYPIAYIGKSLMERQRVYDTAQQRYKEAQG